MNDSHRPQPDSPLRVRQSTRADKRSFGRQLGNDLLRKHGKQTYYSPAQVCGSVAYLDYLPEWNSWGMSVFTSPDVFRAYHAEQGQECDLLAMKSEMTASLTDGKSSSWFDIDLSWMDWPVTDLLRLFEVFW